MPTLIFSIIFMTMFDVACGGVGCTIGLRRRAQIKTHRAELERNRFLTKGYLRKGWD